MSEIPITIQYPGMRPRLFLSSFRCFHLLGGTTVSIQRLVPCAFGRFLEIGLSLDWWMITVHIDIISIIDPTSIVIVSWKIRFPNLPCSKHSLARWTSKYELGQDIKWSWMDDPWDNWALRCCFILFFVFVFEERFIPILVLHSFEMA